MNEPAYTAAEVEALLVERIDDFWDLLEQKLAGMAPEAIHQLQAVQDADPDSDAVTVYREWLHRWSAQVALRGAEALFESVFARPWRATLDDPTAPTNPDA